MNGQNPLPIILFVSAIIMVMIGWINLKKTPQYSEDYKGFTKSKYEGRSKAHWDFSHKYSGKLFLKFACILFGLGFIGFFVDFGLIIGFIVAVTILGIGVTIIRIKVENALMDKFGK